MPRTVASSFLLASHVWSNPRGTRGMQTGLAHPDLLMAETAHDSVMHCGEEPFFADLEHVTRRLV